LAAKQLFQLRTIPALMLGAMVGGTSPAVALPLIKSLRLGDTARAIVVLETAITDVLAIVVTEALLELILAERAHPLSPLVALLREFFGATLFGLLAGYGWAHVQRRVPSWGGSMVATGAAAFLFASLAEAIHLPSPIAALAFGIALGNLRLPSRDTLVTEFEPVVPAEERHILANLAFIFKAYFFVYLGLSLRLSGWEPFVFGGLVTLLIFLLRPFVIRWVIPAHMLPRSQASIVAMLGAKGLASAILASLPVKAGLPEGELLRSVVLGVVLLSITLTSLLVLGRRSRLVVRGYDRMLAPFAPAESPP
ncbi:MAG TPA: cation:proton antiporter, partial [bacterium]|nr:cation:proton antiporter [bacterium]